ncbi:N-acetyltransferase [Desulfuromonas carbonis]
MKIQKVTPTHHAKVYALLRTAFPGSHYEAELVQRLHENGRVLQDWVCLHVNKAIAYIAFSNAYDGGTLCGLHLAPLAVAPEFQRQGVGSELLRFALRQESIRNRPLFVLGPPAYYRRFGFLPCSQPVCPFDKENRHFLSLGHHSDHPFRIGYEPEFTQPGSVPPRRRKQRR